jgi:transcriptional regulator of acetoin/glycerol metabolism
MGVTYWCDGEDVGAGAVTAARRVPVAADEVRSAKDNLIARGLVRSVDSQPLWLPGEIDRSWRRSISAGAARASGEFRFVNEFDADSELARAAHPVLDRLAETLQDMNTAIFLADRSGQIVARRVAGSSDRTRFDKAYAAEGFDFSEESIGTNGLGTPIQEGAAVFVRGPEHFNEVLEDLACTGIGIRHPATGRVIGSLSLAAPVDAAEMMMLAMTREGAQQIVDNLRATTGRRELMLGRSYREHQARGPVIVLNSDTVMTNVTGLSFLNVEMHARLWDSLLAQNWEQGPHVLDLDLQSLNARVLAHRLDDQDEAAFAVEILDRKQSGPTRRSPSRSAGRGDHLLAHLQRVATRSSGALSVTGPSGSGKLHLVREWLRTQGQQDPLVLDASSLEGQDSWRSDATEALDSGRTVVVRRLEHLAPRQVGAVKALAESQPPARLVLTADLASCSDAVRRILDQVTVGVEVPTLASRGPEIASIVSAILDEIDPSTRPVLSAATMQVMLRWDWPGNVAELRQVLTGLAAELPGQSVSPYHLPERMWDAANRRPLTRIEAAERTEIIAALRQSEGNRSRAAALLGIGRTTLYRKLDALGIDDDALLS